MMLDRVSREIHKFIQRVLHPRDAVKVDIGADAPRGLPKSTAPLFTGDATPQELSAAARPAPTNERRNLRVKTWRQRVLQKKGERLYASFGAKARDCSFAMLDETGIVVAWRDLLDGAPCSEQRVLGRHASQFYVPEDIIADLPERDLRVAALAGGSTQQGWHRRPGGGVFWGMTVIDAVLLPDGRLQGFSFVTRRWMAASEQLTRRTTGVRAARPSEAAPAATLRAWSHAAAMILIGVAASSYAATAIGSNAAPANARASQFGPTWECDRGFKREGEACIPVDVPANAYLDFSGDGWKCERGYILANKKCARVQTPANAFLDASYASGWRCDRGYRESGNECIAIVVPANAYSLDTPYGQGWECRHGFRLSGGRCEEVRVPANAYLTRAGDAWKCERGFKQSGETCKAVPVPTNAYLDSRGNDWTCERGFARVESACVPVRVPQNAHLDYSGDDWVCESPYRKKADSCVID